MSTSTDPASTMNQNLLNTQNSWSSYKTNANQQMATLQSEVSYMDQLQAEGSTGAIMMAALVMMQCMNVIGIGMPETDASGNTQYQGLGANDIKIQESTQFGQMATYAQYNFQQLLTEGADFPSTQTTAITPGQTTSTEQNQAGQLTETLNNMQTFCKSFGESSPYYDQAQSVSSEITTIQSAITVNGTSNADVAATIMTWGNEMANQPIPPASGSGSTNTPPVTSGGETLYNNAQQEYTTCNGAFAAIQNNSTGVSTGLQKETQAEGSAYSTYMKASNGFIQGIEKWLSGMVQNQHTN